MRPPVGSGNGPDAGVTPSQSRGKRLARKLTDIAIRNMKPGPARREIPDGNGLYLIVQTSGAKSFALRFRRDGKPTKLTLGTYFSGDIKDAPEPAIGGVLTLKGARKLAADTMLEIGRGGDPAAAKRQTREK